MPIDEQLNARFRKALPLGIETTEKKMMGGVCFLLNGNMIGAASRSKTGEGHFMFRVGKDNDTAAGARPEAQPMVQGGRRKRGFFFVDESCGEDDLTAWAGLAVSFVKTLPAK